MDCVKFYYTASLANVTIPENVCKIGDNAFENCTGLTKIVIPANVREIRSSAFKNCTSLTEIDTQSSVIGGQMFFGCTSLKKITIPKCVKEFGGSPFSHCSSLEEAIIQSEVICEGMFAGCESLKKVTISEGVKEIGAGAFYETGLKDVSIPNSVTKIGENPFGKSQIENIIIPKSVTIMDAPSFKYCNRLKKITIYGQEIRKNAIAFCNSLETVYLSSNVVKIGESEEKTSSDNSEVDINGISYQVKNLDDIDEYLHKNSSAGSIIKHIVQTGKGRYDDSWYYWVKHIPEINIEYDANSPAELYVSTYDQLLTDYISSDEYKETTSSYDYESVVNGLSYQDYSNKYGIVQH